MLNLQLNNAAPAFTWGDYDWPSVDSQEKIFYVISKISSADKNLVIKL